MQSIRYETLLARANKHLRVHSTHACTNGTPCRPSHAPEFSQLVVRIFEAVHFVGHHEGRGDRQLAVIQRQLAAEELDRLPRRQVGACRVPATRC